MALNRFGLLSSQPVCARGWEAAPLVSPTSLIGANGLRRGPDNRLYGAQALRTARWNNLMHRTIEMTVASALIILGIAAGTPLRAAEVSKAIVQAVKDSGRPDVDRQRDGHRKPAEVVAFAGAKPRDKIADLMPGGGYFTRIFSKVVGDKGHVYAIVPAEVLKIRATAPDAVTAIAADKAYANTSVIVAAAADFKPPEVLDIVWISDNYHDLKLPALGPVDTAAVNRAVFRALKPGGIYLVLDHAAAAGTGARDVEALHRIDPEIVKREVVAAGFVLDSESALLHNREDDHTLKASHGAIKGKTDQFILKFRKPGP